MLREAVATAVLALALGAGAARADDCSPEGWVGDVRAPVALAPGGAVVLAESYDDETFGSLGPGDEVETWLLSPLGAAHGVLTAPGFATTAPSFAGGAFVQWRQSTAGSDLIATPLGGGTDRVLVPGLAFPGYRGIAAATAPDETTTLAYGIPAPGGVGPASVGLRRVGPDGTVGPATVLPADGSDVAPRAAVDAQGTAFVVLGGDAAGLAITWPAGGQPTATPSAALRFGARAIVPDRAGGAWLVLAGGQEVHLTAAGVSAPARVVRRRAGERVEAVAVTAAGRAAAAVLRHGRALLLRTGRRTVVLRDRRGYQQGDASIVVSRNRRAWVVWEETSDRLDSLCHEFPVHASVRWAAVGPHARRARSHALPGAAIEQTFAPG